MAGSPKAAKRKGSNDEAAPARPAEPPVKKAKLSKDEGSPQQKEQPPKKAEKQGEALASKTPNATNKAGKSPNPKSGTGGKKLAKSSPGKKKGELGKKEGAEQTRQKAKEGGLKQGQEKASKKPGQEMKSQETEKGAAGKGAKKNTKDGEATSGQKKSAKSDAKKNEQKGKEAAAKGDADDTKSKKKNKNGRKSKRRLREKKEREAKAAELTPEEAEKKAKLEAKREERRTEKKKLKNKKNIQKARARKKAKKDPKPQDPSLLYFSNPLEAPIVKAAKKFFKPILKGKPPFEVCLGPKNHWRVESKLAVRAGPDGLKIGLFLPKSHEVLDYENCAVHHPAIDSAISKIRKAANSLKVTGYNDETGEGQLRYLKMDVERAKGRVQLTLVWNAASEEAAGPSLTAFLARLKSMPIWHSIWVNFNAASKHVDRILEYDENAWKQFHGEESMIREELSSVQLPYKQPRLCFPPTVFRQANLTAFEAIIASLRTFVPEGSRVVEFYGGVGTIGLHLADKVQSLHCSDENPNNERCFRASCDELPEELRSKLKYKPGAAATQLKQLKKATVLVVDPPRKGLESEVLDALTGSDYPDLKTLLYVSCGFPALQRNLAALQSSGWKVTHAAGYLLFPGSDHLETFCVLNR